MKAKTSVEEIKRVSGSKPAHMEPVNANSDQHLHCATGFPITDYLAPGSEYVGRGECADANARVYYRMSAQIYDVPIKEAFKMCERAASGGRWFGAQGFEFLIDCRMKQRSECKIAFGRNISKFMEKPLSAYFGGVADTYIYYDTGNYQAKGPITQTVYNEDPAEYCYKVSACKQCIPDFTKMHFGESSCDEETGLGACCLKAAKGTCCMAAKTNQKARDQLDIWQNDPKLSCDKLQESWEMPPDDFAYRIANLISNNVSCLFAMVVFFGISVLSVVGFRTVFHSKYRRALVCDDESSIATSMAGPVTPCPSEMSAREIAVDSECGEVLRLIQL